MGIQDSRYRIPDFMSVEVRFGIPIVSWIPDSLICIPDSKAQDSRFHKQKELNNDVARFTTHIKPVLKQIKLLTGFERGW